MAEAFAWGLVASSSLLVGAALALQVQLSPRRLGLVMAFGAGVLISAVAYELVLEAAETSDGSRWVAAGLFAGCGSFFAGDALVDRYGGSDRKSMHGRQSTGVALAIVVGIVLDGIPESTVLGLNLLTAEGVSVAFLCAVFLSNLPEAASATSGLAASGWQRRRIYGLWTLVALVSAGAALAGYGLFGDAPPGAIAFVLAFAGGAILTMLADTLMPEAFEQGGKLVGLFTTIGFALAFAIASME